MKPVQFTRVSRRHRIGRAHARAVIASTSANATVNDATGDTILTWVGVDDRGVELEIVAVDLADRILVIHVMPTQYRKAQP